MGSKARDAIVEIDPYLDLWQVAWTKENPRESLRKQGIPFESGNEIWGTTASSYWGNYADYAKAGGWMAAFNRFQGLHTHGYMRWIWNDRVGCFVGLDGPLDTVTVVDYAQSITEGRYLAQLYGMIDYARKMGRAMDLANEIENEISTRIIGYAPDCLLPLVKFGGPNYYWVAVGTESAAYDMAKAKVLELTLQLKTALGDVGVSVHYGDLELVREGTARCEIIGEADISNPLAKAVLSLSGVVIRCKDRPTPNVDTSAVFVGTLRDGAIKAIVDRERPHEISARYPAPGNYVMVTLPKSATSSARLLVVGGDTEGAKKGARNLARLLTATNRW